MVRQHFPGEDPIGKRISVEMFDKPTPTEIVGVVGDVRYDSLVDQPEPTVYFPHPELTYAFMTLVIRTSGDPSPLAPAVQRELREIDRDQPMSDVRTMNQVMAGGSAREPGDVEDEVLLVAARERQPKKRCACLERTVRRVRAPRGGARRRE